jgi:phenylacetate-CoA ligase
MRSYYLPREDLEKLQMRRLHGMLRHAYGSVPFYHELFRQRNLYADDIAGVKDLKRLPAIAKDEVMMNYPHRITARGVHSTIVRGTSGTTGRALRVPLDDGCADAYVALRIRRLLITGVHPLDKLAYVTSGYSSEGNGTNGGGGRGLSRFDSILTGSKNVAYPGIRRRVLSLGRSNLHQVAASVLEFRPQLLYGRPSHLRRIGRELGEMKRELTPKFVLVGGEVVTDACKKELRETFGGEVFEIFGSHELGPLSIQCGTHQGFHLNSDFLVFEVLGRDGEEVGPGERGELVITSLENRAMPLIRYKIGDVVVMDDGGRCTCGSYLPRIKSHEGRGVDGFMTREGTWMGPKETMEHFEGTLRLRDYELVQRGFGSVEVKLRRKDASDPVIHAIESYLKGLLGAETVVRVVAWDEDDMPLKFRPVRREPLLS